MRFKAGDRVVTNKDSFKGSTDPNAESYRGQKGTVKGTGIIFDYAVEMDDKSVADGQWLMQDNELDPVED